MGEFTDSPAGSATAAVPPPAQTLGSLLVLQLYAHDGVSTSSSGQVESWADTRDGGLRAVASLTPPVLVPNVLGNRPAVRFTNAVPEIGGCSLEVADDDRLNPDSGEFRVLVVARNRSMVKTDPPNMLLHKGTSYAIYLERLGDASMGTQFRVQDVNGGVIQRTHTETSAPNVGKLHLYELFLTGNQVQTALDGDFAEGFGAAVADVYSARVRVSDPLVLGQVNQGVDLFAVLVIKGEATAAQLEDVRSYLKSQYAIPSIPKAVAPAGAEQKHMIVTKDGAHARIPALVRCNDGSLVMFAEYRWDGGADTGHIGIVARRSTDGGVTWGEQFTVVDDGENTRGNPVPIVDRSTGRLHLLLCANQAGATVGSINKGTSVYGRRVFRTFSDDNGATWAPEIDVTESVKDPAWRWYATGPGGAEQLAGGRLLVPCNHFDLAAKNYRDHVIYSDDHGETWQIGGTIATDGTNEIQTAQLADGTLVAHIRYAGKGNQPGWKMRATSTDDGLTWSQAHFDYSLPSPAVQDDILVLPDGRVLATNHQTFEQHRLGLAINVSTDQGRTWPASTIIRAGAPGNGASYVDLVHVGGNRIAAVWEAGVEISVRLFDVSYPLTSAH